MTEEVQSPEAAEETTAVEEVEAAPPSSFADLKRKMKFAGTVKKIQALASIAAVDIGIADANALIHLSRIPREGGQKIEDLLKEGQAVDVWISKLSPDKKRVELTMFEPLAVEWREIEIGQVYATGKVVRVEKYGAFVDIGAERPGLLHVRELSTEFVKHAGNLVSIGDEMEVIVSGVNRKKKQIDFTVPKPELEDEMEEDYEEEVEIEVMSPMEYAFKMAQNKNQAKKKKRKKKSYGANKLDDMFERTLSGHDSSE